MSRFIPPATMPVVRAYRRTRIAPTPSGFLHLGNAASFVLTAGLARRHGASILLRIDDMDRDRVRPEYVRDIFDTLRFLGIPWDEGPADAVDFEREYSQLHRMDRYQTSLEALEAAEAVFACTCSRSALSRLVAEDPHPCTCFHASLPLSAPGAGWRILTQTDTPIHMRDISGERISCDLPSAMRHVMVRKKDGYPSYQLTSVVDDIHFGVDLVVRGADLFDSTLAQLHLSGLLPDNDFSHTAFFHHPLLLGSGGEKLSKSDGATSVRFMRESGAKPVDLFRMVAASFAIEAEPETWEELFTLLVPNLGSDGWRIPGD
jgi:glutamyl/glutaminyl-tRNA synthetase